MSRTRERAIFHGSTVSSRNGRRQSDRQVTNRDDHLQHHCANGKGEVALGKFSELRQKRRAGRATEHRAIQLQRVRQAEDLRQGERAKRHQDEIGQQSEHNQPGVAQRLGDLRDGETCTPSPACSKRRSSAWRLSLPCSTVPSALMSPVSEFKWRRFGYAFAVPRFFKKHSRLP